MLGLALEGGGARGAYHIGAYKAFADAGYKFDVITGTSIGAINAAVLAQGDFEKAVELWETVTSADIFDIKDKQVSKIDGGKKDGLDFAYYIELATRVASEGGVDTSKMVALIDKIVDVEKLFKSKTDFGIVSVCLTDRKPVLMFKNEFTRENIKKYIMASATFPGFMPTVIDGKHFIDGGIYDNCPMTMLAGLGCKEIVGVRTFGPGLYKEPKEKDVEVTIVAPSSSLGPIMMFDSETSKKNMQMGYYDALRHIEGLLGAKYYVERPDRDIGFEMFSALTNEQIDEARVFIGAPSEMEPKRVVFEKLCAMIASELNVAPSGDYTDIIIAMLESKAERAGVDVYQKFEFMQFFTSVAPLEAEKPKVRPVLQSAKLKTAAASDSLLSSMFNNSTEKQKGEQNIEAIS